MARVLLKRIVQESLRPPRQTLIVTALPSGK
jgi:hypothetical protein